MVFDRQSIIGKIAAKGIVTPYEAIYLQFLNKIHKKEQIPDVEKWENPYIAAEKISELYTSYDLSLFLSFQTIEEATAYDAYRWAAIAMSRFDASSAELGYKGLGLLYELKYFQSEYAVSITEKLDKGLPLEGNITDFAAYSQIFQEKKTFTQILESFTDMLYCLTVSISNILTLNYYLKTIAKQEDFICLPFISKILTEEKDVPEDERKTNIARMCYEQIVATGLEANHKQFCEFIEWQISFSFNRHLDETFQEGSFHYVKKLLSEYTK